MMHNFSYCQDNKDYYTLFKGGEKYKKIVCFVMLDDNIKKVNKSDKIITYYIGNQMLEHRKNHHAKSVYSLKKVKSLKINTLEELVKIKDKEINLRLEEEDIKDYPHPLNYKMLKIYLLEPIDDSFFHKIEVEWIYTIN
jgi:hypothetical protein